MQTGSRGRQGVLCHRGSRMESGCDAERVSGSWTAILGLVPRWLRESVSPAAGDAGLAVVWGTLWSQLPPSDRQETL